MSHANGAVRLSNGKIYYCEYNGTVDIILPKLFDTYDEMRAEWRSQEWDRHFDGHEEFYEKVEIATDYSGGFSWLGIICTKCKRVVDRLAPNYEEDYKDELPEWFPNA